GILGMKWPLLSSTATSTVTVLTSLRKVGTPSGSWVSFCLPNLEGIFSSFGLAAGGAGASGAASAGAFLLRGFATVSEDSDVGPCWAARVATTPVGSPARARMARNFERFMGTDRRLAHYRDVQG